MLLEMTLVCDSLHIVPSKSSTPSPISQEYRYKSPSQAFPLAILPNEVTCNWRVGKTVERQVRVEAKNMGDAKDSQTRDLNDYSVG